MTTVSVGLVSRTRPVSVPEVDDDVDGDGALGDSAPQPKATRMRIDSDRR
jgi:hypothetical protein